MADYKKTDKLLIRGETYVNSNGKSYYCMEVRGYEKALVQNVESGEYTIAKYPTLHIVTYENGEVKTDILSWEAGRYYQKLTDATEAFDVY